MRKTLQTKRHFTLQGAATTCYLALHPNATNMTGKYFVDCNEETPSMKARDEALGKGLWEFSEELLKKESRQPRQP